MKHRIVSIPPVYFLAPRLNLIRPPFTLGGAIFLCAGAYWIACTHQSLRRRATPVTFAPSTCIIEDGLYHYSRNPMYVGFVSFLTGCSIVSGNVLSLLCPLFLFIILNWMFIPFEEEKMESAFGEKYLEYKKKVRRWL